MKYIVLQGPNGEAAVLFPRSFMHRWVAGLFAPLPVTAAGFVRIRSGVPECYGSSVGLNIAARPARDSALVIAAMAQGDADLPVPEGT